MMVIQEQDNYPMTPYELAALQPVSEVSFKRFQEMLEVLPPKDFHRQNGECSFKVDEPYSGRVSDIFASLRMHADASDAGPCRYFHLRDMESMTHSEIISRVTAFLTEQQHQASQSAPVTALNCSKALALDIYDLGPFVYADAVKERVSAMASHASSDNEVEMIDLTVHSSSDLQGGAVQLHDSTMEALRTIAPSRLFVYAGAPNMPTLCKLFHVSMCDVVPTMKDPDACIEWAWIKDNALISKMGEHEGPTEMAVLVQSRYLKGAPPATLTVVFEAAQKLGCHAVMFSLEAV